MDLQQLQYFRSVARRQHMTRAAEELGMAQPSLSKAIRLLEAELGNDLFDRSGRGIRLNAYGRAFLRHADAVFQSLDSGRRELDDLASARQVTLAVSGVELFWAAGVFRAFTLRRPDVRFRLFKRTLAEIVRQLARHEVDLGLMVDPHLEAVEWSPIVSGAMCVMLPPGHRLWGCRTIRLMELADEPMILPRAGGPLREMVDGCFREAGLVPNAVCESDDYLTMVELVRAGMGLQFIPDFRGLFAAGDDPQHLRVVEPDCAVEMGIGWPRGAYRSNAAQEFAAFAPEYLKKAHRPSGAA